MKITNIEVRLFLKKSQKNLDGGWTTGEEEVKWSAELEPNENPVIMTDKLAKIIKSYLLLEFGIDPNTTIGELVSEQPELLAGWRSSKEEK
jgi:hypothetical protein